MNSLKSMAGLISGRSATTLGVTVLFVIGVAPLCRGDTTWNYAVQISAVVQSAPPRIVLSWPQDDYGASSYTVYRKTKSATAWGSGTTLSGAATNYTDNGVTFGSTYEYQIVKAATLGYTGYGYIFCGIEAPLVEDRGKLILVVANTYTANLASELARLQTDLVGDGWTVIRHDVATNATPASVRNLIIADYNADPTRVNTVFLFGHVPVFHSGNLNYDGHLARPMPSDAYYGDVNGTWNTNLNYLPSDVELMVGRVDMFDMPGNYASIPWPNEVELLRNYLNKDHNWRHGLINVPRRALMGDRRGAEGGLASAVSGYRNFQPLVGPGTTILANVENVSAPEVRWGPMLAADRYLWAYGCGAGSPSAIGELGTTGPYNDLWSIDVVGQDAKAVFVMVFGSWFGNWDGTDNLMRAFLATPTLGLTCCMAGVPHWFVHHMGLGETIGYGTRLSMNNSTLYGSQSNTFTRAIYIALMGDPSLRMDIVSPPSALSATTGGGGVNLNWSSAPDAVVGYHVYRSDSPSGPFLRVNGSLVAGTSFTDASPSPQTATYMVRAVKLQTTPSGTYFNSSQGIFSGISGGALPGVTVVASDSTATIGTSDSATFTFTRTGSTSSDLVINYVLGGSAVSWTDYRRQPQEDMPVSVTIPAAAASTTLTIFAIANSTLANPENVSLTLSSSATYTVGSPSSSLVTIVSGTLPSVVIVANDPTATIGTSDSAAFTFTRTGSTSSDLVINYELGGTAIKWTDYRRQPQGDMPVSITIPAGAVSATQTIFAIANTTLANPETVSITLSPSATYSVGTTSNDLITIVSAANPPGPITVAPNITPTGLMLTWNSQSAQMYRVLAKTNLTQAAWLDLSGSLTATGSSTSWTDTNLTLNPQRFYRIANP